MNRKINAFTLIELVLAMLLTAMVIGMCYSALTIFEKLAINYHSKMADRHDIQVFRQVLKNDIDQHTTIIRMSNAIEFKDSIGQVKLQYTLIPDLIIRSTRGLQDTFKMKDLQLTTTFEGREMTSGIIDQLIFRFDYNKSPVVISGVKTYTSSDLFNYKDSL